jgi:acyl-CoA thioesterase I
MRTGRTDQEERRRFKRQNLFCLFALTALFTPQYAKAQTTQIVALGDSNTAGFGVGRPAAFPARLEAMLRANGTDVQVINAGVSGDTTGGMLARLHNVVPAGTGVVIVQGGYNDLRRGGNPATIGTNIEAILSRLRARQVRTVLCGFYNEPWEAIARRHGAVFVPSSTCYDAANRGFDGLHMTANGHEIVARRLLPVVQTLTGRTKGKARPRRS